MSKLLPNSFSTPNAYIDEFMAFLTPEEYKVLSYTCRRIFGFQDKTADRIALSQYEKGLFKKTGERLDYGTGLSRPAIIAALKSLKEFRLIIKVADNDPRKNQGECYALQTDYDSVDLAGLAARQEAKTEAGRTRTAKARTSKGQSVGLTAVNEGGRLVGLTAPSKSDLPTPVSGTYTQKTEERKKKDREPAREDLSPGDLAVQAFTEVFMQPSIRKAELIQAKVTDLTLWWTVLTEWKNNEWSPRNLDGMLNRYEFLEARQVRHASRAAPNADGPPDPEAAARLTAYLRENGMVH